jgi:hypothetical protein
MVTQKPLVAPTCPDCLAEHEQAVASWPVSSWLFASSWFN